MILFQLSSFTHLLVTCIKLKIHQIYFRKNKFSKFSAERGVKCGVFFARTFILCFCKYFPIGFLTSTEILTSTKSLRRPFSESGRGKDFGRGKDLVEVRIWSR